MACTRTDSVVVFALLLTASSLACSPAGQGADTQGMDSDSTATGTSAGPEATSSEGPTGAETAEATSTTSTSGGETDTQAGSTGQQGTTPVALFFEDFEDYSLPGSVSFGSQNGGAVEIAGDAVQNYDGSVGSARGVYPQQTANGGGVFLWGGVNTWAATQSNNHVYIRLRAKMPGPVKHGAKFIKVFGYNPSDNAVTGYNGEIESAYANITLGLDYTGTDNGGILAIGFGDGSTPTNDTQNVILLNGEYPEWVGRSFGLPGFSVETPNGQWSAAQWGDDWHLFEFYIKFNSGDSAQTEVNDGEILVRIDGVTYIEARGLFNRHWSNQGIEHVDIYNQTQGASAGPFELWYDNIEITQEAWGEQG